ncbi:hypothetical protein AVEN_43104-1 [Araneus ventricosus]|uniref:Uncharacterized protein n=1 Tax=Araneus ventricosus TaxID=182803 RepID=A0A4Y2TT27_ARAVE|nr:hypothetical protein AVEN_43104-1 [Araneus ventricosus]
MTLSTSTPHSNYLPDKSGFTELLARRAISNYDEMVIAWLSIDFHKLVAFLFGMRAEGAREGGASPSGCSRMASVLETFNSIFHFLDSNYLPNWIDRFMQSTHRQQRHLRLPYPVCACPIFCDFLDYVAIALFTKLVLFSGRYLPSLR